MYKNNKAQRTENSSGNTEALFLHDLISLCACTSPEWPTGNPGFIYETAELVLTYRTLGQTQSGFGSYVSFFTSSRLPQKTEEHTLQEKGLVEC